MYALLYPRLLMTLVAAIFYQYFMTRISFRLSSLGNQPGQTTTLELQASESA